MTRVVSLTSQKPQEYVNLLDFDGELMDAKLLFAPCKHFKRTFKPLEEGDHYFIPAGNSWWKMVVPTHKGVHTHETDTDGQAVYQDLVQTYAQGTMASLNVEQMETSRTSKLIYPGISPWLHT